MSENGVGTELVLHRRPVVAGGRAREERVDLRKLEKRDFAKWLGLQARRALVRSELVGELERQAVEGRTEKDRRDAIGMLLDRAVGKPFQAKAVVVRSVDEEKVSAARLILDELRGRVEVEGADVSAE